MNQSDKIQIKKTTQIKRILFEESLRLEAVAPFLTIQYKEASIESQLIGNYNFTNMCAAVTIGNYFKVNLTDIKGALESYQPNNNRSQIIKKGSNNIILDAYNANPTSMKAALESFQLMEAKNKIVILGDMFELGNFKTEEHQKIADFTLDANFNTVLFVGNIFNEVETPFLKFKEFKALEKHLKTHNPTHSTLLIKGSRGMKLERVLELLN